MDAGLGEPEPEALPPSVGDGSALPEGDQGSGEGKAVPVGEYDSSGEVEAEVVEAVDPVEEGEVEAEAEAEADADAEAEAEVVVEVEGEVEGEEVVE